MPKRPKVRPGDFVLYRRRAAEVLNVRGDSARIRYFGAEDTRAVSTRSLVSVWELEPKRVSNPALTVPFFLGTLTGAGLVFFKVGGSVHTEPVVHRIEEGEGAVLLVGPRQKSLYEKSIDVMTGRTGFSHCALYLCMVDDDDNPLIVDCQSTVGVQIRALSEYKDRRVALIPMNPVQTAHARGAALSQLGRPYRGRPQGLTCSEFVASCLPPSMRAKLNTKKMVTPNSIAKAFGVNVDPEPQTADDLVQRLKF